MKTTQKIALVLLIVLLGAAAYGYFRTGQPANGIAKKAAMGSQTTLVDQSPMRIAQSLIRRADTPEEQALSKEAIRLADHEMDLAYESARRNAEAHPPVLSPGAKDIQARLEKAQALQKADQALAEQLKAEDAKASGSKKDALDDRLAEAKAQLESDEDEVDDATQDLIQAGGDAKGRADQIAQEHDALSHEVDTAVPSYPVPLPDQFGLVHQYSQWSALRQARDMLEQARQTAIGAAAELSAMHDALDKRIDAAKEASPDLAAHSKKAAEGAPTASRKERSHEESEAALTRMKEIVLDQKDLTNFDKRADYERRRAGVYAQWSELVAARQRDILHRALFGVLIVLGILLVGVFFDSWLERLLGKLSLDRRQVETLRTVTRVAVQVTAVLLILLVVVGLPGQVGTFLGLAGAGLTVALKDFIVAFIGWLVLMGKNGIRLGDWVEINGVTGEVVELNMFHTVLLETGNWTDSGHPTGRRVTFTNSFAIEGHYFNFSTSGQWLWDELQVVLPTGQDPYPIIDAIQKRVAEATSESAKLAEQEWKSAARSRDMSVLSAAPAINVKPVIGGVEIAVRYITRANERYQLRAKLYQAAVDLLGGRNLQLPPPPAATVPSAD
ncbi:MAG TPA: mechanosensitive ion channel domain-containing protein [Candidatus Acidoferrum sp.]|nr:mechanosensitive ion channel domain-containing protein [Candidatus Acidoferrum sp.]